jgi:hypothetical protein
MDERLPPPLQPLSGQEQRQLQHGGVQELLQHTLGLRAAEKIGASGKTRGTVHTNMGERANTRGFCTPPKRTCGTLNVARDSSVSASSERRGATAPATMPPSTPAKNEFAVCQPTEVASRSIPPPCRPCRWGGARPLHTTGGGEVHVEPH